MGRGVPPAPTQLTAAPGNGTATLAWSAVTNATSYIVQRSTSWGGPYSTVASVSANSYADSNLVNGVTYYYEVASASVLTQSADSAPVSVTPSSDMLSAWFRADAIIGVASGSALAQWADLSGYGNNATQSNSARQPVYLTNAMNGLPVVRFSNAANTSLGFARPVQNDFTIICVFQSAQGLNTGTEFYQGAGLVSGYVAAGANDFGASLAANGRVLAGAGNPDITLESVPVFNDGKPHVMTFTRTQTNGLMTLYVDGTEASSALAGTQALTAPASLVLGAQQTLANYLSGDISEVQVYGSALSNSARQSIETALRIKYLDLARPAMAAPVFNSGTLTLSWPTIPGFNLYSATNLAPPAVWSLVNNPIISMGGTDSVNLTPTNSSVFFQLMDP